MAIAIPQFGNVKAGESLIAEAKQEAMHVYLGSLHGLNVTGLTQQDATVIAVEIGRLSGVLDALDVQERNVDLPKYGYSEVAVPSWLAHPQCNRFSRNERKQIEIAAKRAYVSAYTSAMSN